MKINLEKSMGDLCSAQEVVDKFLAEGYTLAVRGCFEIFAWQWEACFEPGGEVVVCSTLADAVLAAAKAIKVWPTAR